MQTIFLPERESGSATALALFGGSVRRESILNQQRRNLAGYRHTPIRRLSNFPHAAEAQTHSCGTVDARSAEGDVSNVQAHWYRRSGVLHADTVQRHTGAPVRVCPSEGYVRRAPTECEMRCVRTELFPCQSPVTRSVFSTLDANANREPGFLCVDTGGRIQRRNRVGWSYRHTRIRWLSRRGLTAAAPSLRHSHLAFTRR